METPSPPSPHGSAPTPDPVAATSLGHATNAEMPQGPLQSAALRCEFEVGGQSWIAYPSGLGAYGTGHWGLAPVEAIHFARKEAPNLPVLEALLPYGRLESLFPVELEALFRQAREIVIPDPNAGPITPRRFSLADDLP